MAAKLGQFLLFRNETLETDLSRTLEQKALVEQQVCVYVCMCVCVCLYLCVCIYVCACVAMLPLC